MSYTATITSASLRLRESRIVAQLLLDGVDRSAWSKAIYDDKVLQLGSHGATVRVARLLRARLEPMGPDLWRMIREGDRVLATQAALAGAIHNSRLLGDFMDLALREQRLLFATELEARVWTDYLDGCRGRDPNMPLWSDTTRAKLRSVVFSILAEAGYISDTRQRLLQNVFVDAELAAHLEDAGHAYILRCLEVAE